MRQCSVLPILIVLLVAASPLQADSRNAATWYQRAIERMDVLSDADWEAISEWNANPHREPPPAVREALAKAGPVIDFIRRGSQQQYADYQLDYSEGFELLLPHIGRLRSAARLANADALMRMHDGDAYGAADRLASMYSLSEHFGDDAVLISSLVSMVTFEYTDETVRIGLDRGLFDTAEADVLRKATERFANHDPFAVMDSTAMEQELAVSWIETKLGTAEQRANAAEELDWLDIGEQEQNFLAAVTDEQLQTDLDLYDAAMDRVVEAFTMEDRDAGRAALEALEAEVRAGKHGFVATAIMPSFLGVFNHMIKAEKALEDRQEMLRRLARGEISPADEANAAYLYAGGIETMRTLERERLDAVLIFAIGEKPQLDDELTKTLADAAPIIDAFREGSHKKRCDFEFLRLGWQPRLCPDYIAGMHEAMRLILADTRRAIAAGDHDAAVDRLAILYRVIAHLSDDEPLLSARIAHDAFDRVYSLTEQLFASDSVSEAHRTAITDAARRIGRSDPFGYIHSISALRSDLPRHVGRHANPEEDAEVDEQIKRTVDRWDGDELLYALAVFDTLRRAGEEKSNDEAEPDPCRHLRGVIDVNLLAAARSDTARLAPLLAQGEFDLIGGRDVPHFAAIERSTRSVRSELRQALRVLIPEPERFAPLPASNEKPPGDD